MDNKNIKFYLTALFIGFLLNILFNIIWSTVFIRFGIEVNKYVAMTVFFIICSIIILFSFCRKENKQ